MLLTLAHKDLTIEIYDDSAFTRTPDSPTVYDKVLQADQDLRYVPNAQHAVKVYHEKTLISSAILLASGGGTGVLSDSALVDGDDLIIRCCNKLFSLRLPDLTTNWIIEADDAVCFSIYQYQDTYISHGELTIARIDKKGNILWQFGGSDIFVCLYKGTPFEMFDDHIALTDFDGKKYHIDYNGKSLNIKDDI